MKKSVVYRTLQVATAVIAYSLLSVWASTKHIDIVSNLLTELDSLLVIVAIALVLPYLCFKALGKLYTPPKSLNLDKSSQFGDSPLTQDELDAIAQEDLGVMQYRGNQYNPEDLTLNTSPLNNDKNSSEFQPVIKYRGVSIAADSPSQNGAESFLTPKDSQKSAKPKERIKYRGSYVD